jgi:hypothetical protein
VVNLCVLACLMVVVSVMVAGLVIVAAGVVVVMHGLAVFDVIAAVSAQAVERVVLTVVQEWISVKKIE